jgi:hypothetical protein
MAYRRRIVRYRRLRDRETAVRNTASPLIRIALPLAKSLAKLKPRADVTARSFQGDVMERGSDFITLKSGQNGVESLFTLHGVGHFWDDLWTLRFVVSELTAR